MTMHTLPAALLVAGTMALAPVTQAAAADIMVTIDNLAPTNSVSFAPLGLAFHQGSHDPFNAGSAASAELQTLAELGNPADWITAFGAGDPGAVLVNSGGPLFPGASAMLGSFTLDPTANRFVSFAAMVVPSNDYFIGNDSPNGLMLFDGSGHLVLNEITVFARQVWNAGTETTDPSAAAFIVGAVATDRTPENGVIGFDFADLASFNGLATAAGYSFDSQLAADTEIFRIRFTQAGAVPEPASWAMMIGGLGIVGGLMRQRRRPATGAARA